MSGGHATRSHYSPSGTARQSASARGRISSVEQLSDRVTVGWQDGHESQFHHIWLRDCCYCDQCGDSYSSKRYFVPGSLPSDLRPATVTVSAEGDLVITWMPEDHISLYNGSWLRQHCYDAASRATRHHVPTRWSALISESIPTSLFQQAVENEACRLALYRQLRDFGMVLVREGPTEPGGVEQVANLIGDLGDTAYSRIFDLTPSSSINTLGNTFKTVPPHTDEAFRFSPPGINILGCVQPAISGGESVLVDGFHIATLLRESNPAGFDLLTRYGHTYNRIHPGELDQRGRLRIIALDDRGEVAGIRLHTRSAGPLDLPSDIVIPYYAAYQELCTLMMHPENQLKLKLEAGESILFDNHRVLHSRTAFQDSGRFLQICNVSREDFHERLRLLTAQMGFETESNMVLAAGMAW